jgi:hypothetical protein
VDTISFGSDREPWRWRPNWRFRGPGHWRRWWLLAAALVIAAVLIFVLFRPGGHVRSHARVTRTARLLTGVPARGSSAELFLGGDYFWWFGRHPRIIDATLLDNGLSPLLPRGDSAQVDQLLPVRGGVVAHISDIASGITYGALGRIVFIPASHQPAKVIGRATIIAVPPGGQRVWLQTAVQRPNNGAGAPPNARSPTWAVDLAGRRVTPVLRLPFGLVDATEMGPLTQTLSGGRLQLWNGANGRMLPLPVPAHADFISAGQDRLVWFSYARSPRLHITDLRTGTDVAVAMPSNWAAPSQPYPPAPASFDPTGQQLVLPLDRTDKTGNVTAEDLFVVNTTTHTMRMIPSRPLPVPDVPGADSPTTLPDTLAGSWNQQGVLWVLAMNPYYSYYQLGFWTGQGPLHTLKISQGNPAAMSPPG